MELTVSEGTVREAVQCERGHACLCGEGLCEVDAAAFGEVLFCRAGRWCRYQMPFGDGAICRCPVRKEIYRRYHL